MLIFCFWCALDAECPGGHPLQKQKESPRGSVEDVIQKGPFLDPKELSKIIIAKKRRFVNGYLPNNFLNEQGLGGPCELAVAKASLALASTVR